MKYAQNNRLFNVRVARAVFVIIFSIGYVSGSLKNFFEMKLAACTVSTVCESWL